MSAELVNSYINDIAKRLHDPNQFGSASVMIGAGFSKNAISLAENSASPSWEELAREMYAHLYPTPEKHEDRNSWEKSMIKKTSGRNSLKLAEEFRVVFGRNKLDKFIEENIHDDKYTPGDLHIKLLELNWNDVFTTNYDTLLERAIDKISVRKNYKIVLKQSDLPGSTRPRIIKLHGSIPNGKPYIICEEDYRTYPVKYAPFVNTVQQSMLETQLCLIGFSGDDPNFLNWLGWLRDNMGENCPQIYLCGVFNDMSESEHKFLESQNISVVNLDCLIDEKSSNRHYDALNIFLKKLESYGKEERNLFKKIPYNHESLTNEINDKYYDKLIRYTREIKAEISKYVALPIMDLISFSNEMERQFIDLSKAKNDINKFALMGNFVFILRKLYIPLYDNQAKIIEELIQEFNIEKLIKNVEYDIYRYAWFELSMYLAEMYRVDGEEKKYTDIISFIDSKLSFLDLQQKADYYIERCKYSISKFDYIKALEYVKNIDESISYEVKIKKPCILVQLGDREKALDILKKCSALLAQTAYTEDKIASLTSYMNLCARSLNMYANLDDFSDYDFISNKYNVRNIFNDVKSSLIDNLLLCENNRGKVKKSFNPNSHTITYGTTPNEVIKSMNDSFRYLLLQDNLCLSPEYSDHRDTIAKASMELISTSNSPLWKWAYIIRTNDEKIIRNFFSKELIVTSNKEWAENLFDYLILLLESFAQKESYSRVKKILTQKTIYEVLSRVCIILDNDRISKLLEKIFKIIPEIDEIYKSDMHNILNRLSYCFNAEILKNCIIKILESSSYKIPLANYFNDINLDSIEIEIPEELIFNIIKEISNSNIEIRDNGISKVILLNNYKGISKHYDTIANAIWSQLDEYEFPKTNIYSVNLWEKLPYNTSVIFKELYVNYLKKPNFPKCVNGNSIYGISNVNGLIYFYINCIYSLSDFSKSNNDKITWNEDIINSIFVYLYDYLNNEM